MDNQEKEETLNLMTSESFIIFNNLKGKIVLWVNCDKEMVVKIPFEDFRKIIYDLLPGINVPNLLSLLNQGFYVYTDKKQVKPLRPDNTIDMPIIPSLKESLKNNKEKKATPFGFFLN